MNTLLVVAFTAAVLAILFIAIGALGRYASRQRRAGMYEFAARNNLTPSVPDRVPNRHPDGDQRPSEEAGESPLFSRRLTLFALGQRGYADHLVEAREGAGETRVFDYVFFDGRKRRNRRRAQTVVRLRKSGRDLPPFTVKPRQDRSKLGASRHFQHAEEGASADFRAHYALCTETAEGATWLLGEPALTTLAKRPGLCVEGAGPDLIVFLSGQELAIEALPALLGRAREISAGLRT